MLPSCHRSVSICFESPAATSDTVLDALLCGPADEFMKLPAVYGADLAETVENAESSCFLVYDKQTSSQMKKL